MKLTARQPKGVDPLPVASNPTKSSESAAALSHEEIAVRAEALWRERGCPQGCDEGIWLEAERQLPADRRQRFASDERDRTALADPRFDFNRNSNDLMAEVNERFPGATGKETTSL